MRRRGKSRSDFGFGRIAKHISRLTIRELTNYSNSFKITFVLDPRRFSGVSLASIPTRLIKQNRTGFLRRRRNQSAGDEDLHAAVAPPVRHGLLAYFGTNRPRLVKCDFLDPNRLGQRGQTLPHTIHGVAVAKGKRRPWVCVAVQFVSVFCPIANFSSAIFWMAPVSNNRDEYSRELSNRCPQPLDTRLESATSVIRAHLHQISTANASIRESATLGPRPGLIFPLYAQSGRYSHPGQRNCSAHGTTHSHIWWEYAPTIFSWAKRPT